METFNVLLWDFNRDELEYYDVLPYLRDRYEEKKKRSKEFGKDAELSKYWKVPETLDEFKKFIMDESRYQFWARCQYEMICHGWPVRKNDHKLDVHEQIMMNLDVIAKIMYDELGKKNETEDGRES